MIRRYHCHPQISISARGPVVRNKPLHLRQSDLDGACGPHYVLMSLVILGLTKYRQVQKFSDTTDKKLSKVWEKALEYYFSGCGPKELLGLYAPYKERLTWRFAKKDYLHKAVECLSQGGICILGLSNKDMDHWVLAVGLSYPLQWRPPPDQHRLELRLYALRGGPQTARAMALNGAWQDFRER